MKRDINCCVVPKRDALYAGVVVRKEDNKVTVAWLIPSHLYPKNSTDGRLLLESLTTVEGTSLIWCGVVAQELIDVAKKIEREHGQMTAVREMYPKALDKYLAPWDEKTIRLLPDGQARHCYEQQMRNLRIPPEHWQYFPDIHEVFGYP